MIPKPSSPAALCFNFTALCNRGSANQCTIAELQITIAWGITISGSLGDDVIFGSPYVWNKLPYEVHSIFQIPYGPVWSMEYG